MIISFHGVTVTGTGVIRGATLGIATTVATCFTPKRPATVAPGFGVHVVVVDDDWQGKHGFLVVDDEFGPEVVVVVEVLPGLLVELEADGDFVVVELVELEGLAVVVVELVAGAFELLPLPGVVEELPPPVGFGEVDPPGAPLGFADDEPPGLADGGLLGFGVELPEAGDAFELPSSC